MLVYDKGTCLLVEGMGFEVTDDTEHTNEKEVGL